MFDEPIVKSRAYREKLKLEKVNVWIAGFSKEGAKDDEGGTQGIAEVSESDKLSLRRSTASRDLG